MQAGGHRLPAVERQQAADRLAGEPRFGVDDTGLLDALPIAAAIIERDAERKLSVAAHNSRFFDAVRSPRFKWAFNVGHAHLVPDGFDGFLDAFGVENIGQVRLNDTHSRYEEHLPPGQGIVDFRHVFRRLTERGYRGPFTLDFGTAADRAHWRDTFAQWLSEATPID